MYPSPEKTPNINDSNKLSLSFIFIITAPSIAQFVVISGKNIPRALYKLGLFFLITISTN